MWGEIISGIVVGILGGMAGSSYAVVSNMTEEEDRVDPVAAQRGMWVGAVAGVLTGAGGYYYFFGRKVEKPCEGEKCTVETVEEPKVEPVAEVVKEE
jgi:hypothetical protein